MADQNTQPYKGTRDFYPEEMRIQRYIFKIWEQIAERFGYERYGAPLLELTELYRAKTGEEIVNEQSYNFKDRGGREVTIRPEMTPSLARMVAARQQELSYPLRWYSIDNFWRYERPQAGRMREHWQLNADLLGVENIEADTEIIRLASAVMSAFGANSKTYEIRINSRKLISLLLGEHLKLDVEKSHRVFKLIDRKNKMSESAFTNQVETVLGSDADKMMNLLNIKSLDDLPTTVIESGVVEELRGLMDVLDEYGISNVRFDLTLMRGLDYYTGMVFEIFDTNPENKRSIFGGGRYDDLTGIFGVAKVPAVGFGMGDVTTRDFLETHKLLPYLYSTTKAQILVAGAYIKEAQKLARNLRKNGINVAVDISGKKLESQLKSAVKKQIPFAIFVGEDEVKSNTYTLRDLTSKKESKKDIVGLVENLK